MNATARESALVKGALWSVGGAGLSRALLLLGSVAVGRLLGVLEFGKLGMMQSTVGLFGALAGATLGVTATRFVAHFRTSDPAQAGSLLVKAYRLGLASGVGGSLIVFVAAPLLGGKVLSAPELISVFRVAGLLVFFGAVNGVQMGILAGLSAFPMIAVASILRGGVSLLGMGLGAWKFGLWGAIGGQLAAELVSAAGFHAAILYAARAQGLTLVAATSSADLKALTGFAIPTLLATIVLQPVLWFGSVLLAKGPQGFVELGLFTASERWRQALLFLPASLASNVLATLSQLEGEGNRALYRKVFRKSLGLIVLAVVLPGAAVIAFAPLCLSVFGKDYREGATTLIVLVASTLPVALNTSVGQLLQTRGQAWSRFAADAVMALLILVCVLLLVPRFGATGFAAAHFLGYSGAVGTIVAMLLFHRRQSARRPLLIHITTIPETLRFLRGQPAFMRRAGFDVAVISSPGAELSAFAAEQQVLAYAVPMARRIAPLRDLVSLCRLVLLLLRLRPTIVHAHTPKAGLLGMIASALVRTSVRIYHLHGLPLETARGSTRKILCFTERVACGAAHRVLAVSSSLRELAVSLSLVSEQKISVPANGSANGVDPQKDFNPELHVDSRAKVRSDLSIPKDALVVGFVGRIVCDKGVVELVEAWKRLRPTFPNSHLLLVGPEEEADGVPPETMAWLRSDFRAHPVGQSWDVAPFLAAMDVLALPTHREGFGYVLLEAAAMGLPTVATRTTGCVDAVLDGRTGTLVPIADVESLTDAVARYLRSEELRRIHGATGRERAIRRFDHAVIWRAILDEYQSALNPPSTSFEARLAGVALPAVLSVPIKGSLGPHSSGAADR